MNEIKKTDSNEIKEAIMTPGTDIAVADLLILEDFQSIGIKIKDLQEEQNILKQDVIDIMEDYKLKKYENDHGVISYVGASTRNSIDSTRLKKELPEVADEYTKASNVKASVRFSVKK